MSYKQSAYSTEEKIKLAGETSKDRLYEPKLKSRKKLRILTVIAYIFCVSLAAIMLSLYYVFLWDPSVNNAKPHVVNCVANCEKIVIPENLAIRLANSTEISLDTFFHNFYKRLRLIQVTEIPNTKKLRIKEISMRPILRTISQLSQEQDTNPNNNETVDNEEKDDFDDDKHTDQNAGGGDPMAVTKSYEKFDFLTADNKNLITMPSESPNHNVDDDAEQSDYEQSGNQNDEAVYLMKLNDTTNNDYDQDVID